MSPVTALVFPLHNAQPKFRYSSDGVVWNEKVLGLASAGSLRGGAEGKGRIVLVGEKGQIFTTADGLPALAHQPQSQSVTAGQAAILQVAAYATGPFSFQWKKDGVAISGATNPTLTLSNVQSTAAGSYTVVVMNSVGFVTSNTAVLTVTTPLAIATQPQSQTIPNGGNLLLSVAVSGGAGPVTYQWRFNGTPIPNGASSTYTASNIGSGFTGTFDVIISDGVSSVTSVPAKITVVPVTRISNLSILTNITTATPLFTVGTVIGGAGTSGSKPLLVRAAGPSLTQFAVVGALPDPKFDMFSGQTVIGTNDNWGGTSALSAIFAQLGAFAYTSPDSKDAAGYAAGVPAGNYTLQVSGVGGATGTVIAELYDATPTGAFTATTPRLINVSVLKQINVGEILTVGFVIAGSTSKQMLIRAVGPTLNRPPFNVSGVMADPKLDLFNGQTFITSNNDWGDSGGVTLLTAFGNVGAFMLGANSRDAALLVKLEPSSYSAQVTGVNSSAGLVLVEVYEVP